MARHGLPLPLGGNVVRKALGSAAVDEIAGILKASIEFGLDHREEAVRHSLQWARGMGFDLADKFVGMYVNQLTLDYGDRGRLAVQRLLDEAYQHRIIPRGVPVEFAGAS